MMAISNPAVNGKNGHGVGLAPNPEKAPHIVRDLLVAWLPKSLVPNWLTLRLYGYVPDFAFVIHPRSLGDIFRSWPLGRRLRKVLPERLLLRLVSLCPAYVLSDVSVRHLRGIVVTTTLLPLDLYHNKVETLRALKQVLNFIEKLSRKKVYVGLGGWWPSATDGGKDCRELVGPQSRLVVTNGQCATLLSLYQSIEKIAQLGEVSLDTLDVGIIGTGGTGGGLSELLNGSVRTIVLVDRDEARAQSLSNRLLREAIHSAITLQVVSDNDHVGMLGRLLSNCHVVICTTTNTGELLREEDLPAGCIVIDDSRPEAFPRVLDEANGRVVLEGGLVRFGCARVSYDFGFGRGDDLFGCLADACILALEEGKILQPTVGSVDRKNFRNMSKYCEVNAIVGGAFRSGRHFVPPALIRRIIREKRPGMTKELGATLVDN